MMLNTIINRTQNGQVFRCSKCKAIHIEYKNLNFNFSVKQFDHFADYLTKLDGKYWENKNKNSQFKRKIIVPIGHQSFRVLLSKEELDELKQLFFIKEKPLSVVQQQNIMNMNFTLILN
jgi:hypothetical protein